MKLDTVNQLIFAREKFGIVQKSFWKLENLVEKYYV
jgi:hypothetical protein